MAESVNRLFGSCACERNVYSIDLPTTATSTASVFFDNSLQTRRQQASPVALWLRVPLDIFHSSTIAQFPDETHSSIRRTFTSYAPRSQPRNVRRQFCGYCGTHLTAFDQEQSPASAVIDVTLGSLFEESLQQLEALNILPDEEPAPEEADTQTEGLVKGGRVDEDTHVKDVAKQERVNEAASLPSATTTQRHAMSRYMQHRGLPYFEEMIEDSSLGRIKRQKGGHVTDDGTTRVEWEVLEVDGDEEMGNTPIVSEARITKKIKLDA